MAAGQDDDEQIMIKLDDIRGLFQYCVIFGARGGVCNFKPAHDLRAGFVCMPLNDETIPLYNTLRYDAWPYPNGENVAPVVYKNISAGLRYRRYGIIDHTSNEGLGQREAFYLHSYINRLDKDHILRQNEIFWIKIKYYCSKRNGEYGAPQDCGLKKHVVFE